MIKCRKQAMGNVQLVVLGMLLRQKINLEKSGKQFLVQFVFPKRTPNSFLIFSKNFYSSLKGVNKKIISPWKHVITISICNYKGISQGKYSNIACR